MNLADRVDHLSDVGYLFGLSTQIIIFGFFNCLDSLYLSFLCIFWLDDAMGPHQTCLKLLQFMKFVLLMFFVIFNWMLRIKAKPKSIGGAGGLHVADIFEATDLFEEAERIYEVGHFIYRDRYVANIFKWYFVATRLNRHIRLHILQSKQKLGHANTECVLADFAHVIKVEL